MIFHGPCSLITKSFVRSCGAAVAYTVGRIFRDIGIVRGWAFPTDGARQALIAGLSGQEQDVFRLSRPDDAAVQEFLLRQSSLDFSYSEIGATASGVGPPSPDYHWDDVRVSLGSGRETFTSAVAAFRSWRQFDVGWAEAVPSNTPIETGQVIAVRARIAGVWTLHACRIIYVIDEPGPITRFGFGYGTLPGHAEAGEERFLIEWDQSTNEVSYEISAFFRPRHPLVRLGWPIGMWLVNRFRRDSAAALQRAVRAESITTA